LPVGGDGLQPWPVSARPAPISFSSRNGLADEILEGAMIPTFFSARQRFRTRAWAIAGAITLLACGARSALAQSSVSSPGFLEHEAVMPPLLFREVWQQPPHTGPLDDENRRITPQALTNPDLELRLYGTDARSIQVTEHNGIPDLWTGFATSPVALTLRHKNAYLDLTGLTRMRWRTRTENLHVLHPVVKLADGTLLVGSQTFSSPQRPMIGSNAFSGNFVVSEVTFDDQRWFQLDPVKVVTMKEIGTPDLSRVDEIGFVDLMPGGGHGFAGCSNVSWIEVYANPRKR
jgi:hypothetical protein